MCQDGKWDREYREREGKEGLKTVWERKDDGGRKRGRERKRTREREREGEERERAGDREREREREQGTGRGDRESGKESDNGRERGRETNIERVRDIVSCRNMTLMRKHYRLTPHVIKRRYAVK